MYQLIVENEKKEQLDLNINYFTEFLGLNPPGASINISRLAGVDGGFINSTSVNSRNIILMITPQIPVEVNRIKLYDFFIIGQKVKIYYINGQRNIYTEGYVETLEGSLFSRKQTIQISILCPEAYLKGASEIRADISKLLDEFEFPYSTEFEGKPLSTFNQYLIGEVNNEGDVETGLIIELTANGTVKNPTIYNANTRENMTVTIDLIDNDLLVINTIKGKTSIYLSRNGVTTNVINKLNDGATWLQANPGINFYTYTADVGLDDINVLIRANALYSGV